MEKKQIVTDKAPSPVGPYSQGIATDDYVFVSGQRPADPVSGELKEGIKEQTRQVIVNLQRILEEGGCTLDDLIRTTVYLSDITYFDEMNEVYQEMIPMPYPTRTTFGVQLRGILVEIDAIALKNRR